jgi:opacity protein-like surface antigen
MKPRTYIAALICITAAGVRSAEAQALYVGVRGGAGIPTGEFSEKPTSTGNAALLRAASPGLGYGFDAGLGASLVGFYASYDRIQFGCQSGSCATSGKYELTGVSAGARVGIPLLPLLKPWAKAGITYMQMKGSVSGSPVTTGKRQPGYEVGAGVDIPILMGFFSLSPQIKMVRQKLEPVIATSSATTGGKRPADFYVFSLGLNVRSPI